MNGYVDHIFRDPIKDNKILDRSKSKKSISRAIDNTMQPVIDSIFSGNIVKAEQPCNSSRNLKFEFDKSIDDDLNQKMDNTFTKSLEKRNQDVLNLANGKRKSLSENADQAMIVSFQKSSQESMNSKT